MEPKLFFENYGGFDRLNYIKTAEKISDDMLDFFNEVFSDIKDGIFLSQVPKEDYTDALIDLYATWAAGWFDGSDNGDMRNHAASFADEIIETTKKTIENSSDDAFVVLYNEHAIIDGDEIPDSVLAALSRDRSDLIGNNESLFINNYSGFYTAAFGGKKTKVWRTCEDERVRMSHNMVDGVEKPIEESFEVGGFYMLFPRDDSMGAPIDETINCRCWLEYY